MGEKVLGEKPLYNSQEKLAVFIRSRKKTFYDGPAYSVTSYNDKGIFDVLPQHSNFISLIKDRIVVRDVQNKKQEFKIESGVMRVNQNDVDVFLDVGTQLS